MTIHYITLKQCSRKDKCVNPLGSWLPETREYFYRDKHHKNGLTPDCKVCRLADNARWREENPTYFKELYASDPEPKKQSVRQYRREHSDEVRAKDRDRYTRRADQQITNARSRRKSEHGQVIAHLYRSRSETKMKHRLHQQKRRAQELQSVGCVTKADICLQLQSQKSKCWWCGAKIIEDNFHVDHLIPLSRGGAHDVRNIVVSCPTCNLSKGAKLPQEWNGRLL